jgi:peroxiredoxin
MALPYDVLCDVDFGVGAAFGVVFTVPEDAVAMFRTFGLDFPARHGTEGWMLPIPATFVVDRTGIVRAAHVDPDFTRRMDPDDLIAVLHAIGREG